MKNNSAELLVYLIFYSFFLYKYKKENNNRKVKQGVLEKNYQLQQVEQIKVI